MEKDRVEELVRQLADAVNLHDTDTIRRYTTLLHKHVGAFSVSDSQFAAARRLVAAKAPVPEAFEGHLDSLSGSTYAAAKPLVALLAKLREDRATQAMLAASSTGSGAYRPESTPGRAPARGTPAETPQQPEGASQTAASVPWSTGGPRVNNVDTPASQPATRTPQDGPDASSRRRRPPPSSAGLRQSTAQTPGMQAAASLGETLAQLSLNRTPAVGEGDRYSMKDPTVLCYGASLLLRSAHSGHSLAARQAHAQDPAQQHSAAQGADPQEAAGDGEHDREWDTASAATARSAVRSRPVSHGTGGGSAIGGFVVSVDGTSVGHDLEERFTIVNASFRDAAGPVRYGDVVALSTLRARQRFLGGSEGTGAFLRRGVFGANEKWTVLPAELGGQGRVTGNPVRAGEAVLLRSARGMHLCVREGEEAGVCEDARRGDAAVWQLLLPNCPLVPAWRDRRPFQTDAFLSSPAQDDDHGAEQASAPPLDTLPAELQERALLEDLLAVVLGFPGSYVRFQASADDAPGTFLLDRSALGQHADPSLSMLLTRMLPIGSYVLRLNRFVRERSRPEHGRVAHALAASVRTLLDEFTVVVAQLESLFREDRLSMQRAWYYMQPSLRTLETLRGVADSTRGCKGGTLLDALGRVGGAGSDRPTRELLSHLCEEAWSPFWQMVGKWVFEGEIDDPFQEFMVREKATLARPDARDEFVASYWRDRYALQAHLTPRALQHQASKILTTGKYLNVVRECGRAVACPVARPLAHDPSSRPHHTVLEGAHHYASNLLLALLKDDAKLIERLEVLRRVFLFGQGDLFVHFLDLSEELMDKPISSADFTRLNQLLQRALGACSVAIEPFEPEELTCALEPFTLLQHLEAVHRRARASTGPAEQQQRPVEASAARESAGEESEEAAGGRDGTAGGAGEGPVPATGPLSAPHLSAPTAEELDTSVGPLSNLDGFTLNLHCAWPFSLVVSRPELLKYQMLFRHILLCKHAERRLAHAWIAQQATRELHIRGCFGRAHALRYRMLHFVQTLVYYVSVEVVEPRWNRMREGLRGVGTVDELMRHHVHFLDSCLKDSLLTDHTHLRLLSRIIALCTAFADALVDFARGASLGEESVQRAVNEAVGKLDQGRRRGDARSKARRDLVARRSRLHAMSKHVREHASRPSFHATVEDHEARFGRALQELLVSLVDSARRYGTRVSNLVSRLEVSAWEPKE